MKDLLNTVVGRIGIVREPVLAFALLAAILMGLGGCYLAGHEREALNIHGIIMIYIGVVMLFASLGIYVWMLARLPGSAQEVALNDVADALIQEHNAKRQQFQTA